MKLEEAKLKRGYVVQVIVNFPPSPATPPPGVLNNDAVVEVF